MWAASRSTRQQQWMPILVSRWVPVFRHHPPIRASTQLLKASSRFRTAAPQVTALCRPASNTSSPTASSSNRTSPGQRQPTSADRAIPTFESSVSDPYDVGHDKGLSSLNVPLVWVTYGNYLLPSFKGNNFLVKNVLGGWQLALSTPRNQASLSPLTPATEETAPASTSGRILPTGFPDSLSESDREASRIG